MTDPSPAIVAKPSRRSVERAAAVAARAGAVGWWRRHQMTLTPALLLAPTLILCSVFVYYPIVESIRLSFHDWDGIGPKVWVGWGNYAELLGDPVVHTALANNAAWLAVYLVAAPALGLAIAVFLNQSAPGVRLARSLFYMPFVISQVVVGLVFAWFLHAEFGLLNQVLAWLGLPPVAPLEDERWAIFGVILAGLWPQIAYCTILYLAGLTGVGPELVDAARVDGAKGWSLLRHVVIPELRPITFIVAMVCVVGALRSFDLVMIMTGGGPYDSSTVLGYYMYEQTFLGFRYGYAAAIATVMFLLMGGCIALFLWNMLRRERD